MVKQVEVVMISEEEQVQDINMMLLLDENQLLERRDRSQEDISNNATRTEASLSKLESLKFLRVLLVEFDDSTRSIISALLRKSGYRVVAVPDGLKAWDMLKGKPQTIDLVLAEVELPSISGFSLLGMIMEDEICRNIPVIMMSPYDAVNLVFKCMLRGAVDFLVKPVRKNELRNLWQHVWRRNSVSSTELIHQNCNPSQQNQAIEESSSTKNSSHCVASSKEIGECSDKGSDAHSSCAKLGMEDDNVDMASTQNLLQLKSMNVSSVKSMKTSNMEYYQAKDTLTENETEVEDKSVTFTTDMAPCNQSTYIIPEENHANVSTMGMDSGSKTQQEDANIRIGSFHANDGQSKPTREAMDLIGSFNNQLNQYNTQFQEVVNTSKTNFDPNRTGNSCSSSPRLELSLKRSHFSGYEVQGVADIQPLKRSTASAFSRYNQRSLQSPTSESKDQLNHRSQTADVLQQGVISVPIPVRSQIGDGVHMGYGTTWPQLFYTPVGPLPLQSPKSVTQQEPVFHVCPSDQPNTDDIYECKQYDATVYKQRNNVDSIVDSRPVHATAAACTSSLSNSSSSNFNSSGCGSVCDGSNGNETAATIVQTVSTGHGGGVVMANATKGTDTNSQTQREAALNKFRLKRKDRCFEKKVRYQSRKKLAEQRPRVKGQFVRQMAS